MVKGRSGFILIFIIVLGFVIYNISDILPGTYVSSLYSPSRPENAIKISPGLSQALHTTKHKSSSENNEVSHTAALNYFGQVFAQEKPIYDFPALREHCATTTWPEDEVYLQCGGMAAGLTSIMSQVKVCLKMAAEAGTGIILPSMPLRDSTNLQEFNFLNGNAYMPYDDWFDVTHLSESLASSCPQMKIVHPQDLDSPTLPVKNKWNVDLGAAPGYLPFAGVFWTGKPFKSFFEGQLAALEELAFMNPDKDDSKKGITVVSISSQFLIFRVTDDPTQGDLRLWNDLGLLMRFKDEPRIIVDHLLGHMGRPFYGVHFRVESDTIWSGLEHQLAVDLDALDVAWKKYGRPDEQKPLVYLACGDQLQIEKFVEAGALRGWEVTHKWAIANSYPETLKMINRLPFDFQGAVDMGIMVKSEFFLGITGSAFSSTIGNARDATGRYRGSSFLVPDDQGARTHLFNDGDAGAYACCL
jgi:hypothetical protein